MRPITTFEYYHAHGEIGSVLCSGLEVILEFNIPVVVNCGLHFDSIGVRHPRWRHIPPAQLGLHFHCHAARGNQWENALPLAATTNSKVSGSRKGTKRSINDCVQRVYKL